VDRLSALMVLLTQLVALPSLWYACGGWDQRGRHFHAIFQFQLMGLNGAFLTGDLFNLFVFFEILLIASYVLLLHGLGAERLRMGLHYVVLNLVGSALFLVGLAMVYSLAGTLNMADLSLHLAALEGDSVGLARSAAGVLLVVFGLKAALVPLSFWLPGTYANAPGPVAALRARAEAGEAVTLTLCGERHARRFGLKPRGWLSRLMGAPRPADACALLATL